MAFVVGKLGKAPDGSRVAIELTGPLARTIRVAVDGRAALVDDFGAAAPTATIPLDGLQFTQLCGGRPMFENHSESIEYDGDAEVGQRVVAESQLRDLSIAAALIEARPHNRGFPGSALVSVPAAAARARATHTTLIRRSVVVGLGRSVDAIAV